MKSLALVVTLALTFTSSHAANLAEVATEQGLTTLVDLVTQAGLADVLSNEGPFTVLAPTDEAFAKLPQELLDTLTNDPELLTRVLQYHLVPDTVMSADIEDDASVESVEGSPLRFNVYLKSDFYPGFITVNGKRIHKADIEADNGVIHTITDVIYPFPKSNIVEVLETDEESRFSTLVTAIDAAGLRETLEGEGPFTLFAPTNDAFAKIPEETLNGLLEDPEALSTVLLRHALPRSLFQKGISWQIRDTAGDEQLQTQVFKGGVVKVVSLEGGARIQETDLVANNGVVHVIDSVI